jgi:hypothetical protein
MRLSRLLVLPVVAAALAVPQAAAAGTGELWVTERGVMYDVCHRHPYGYSVTPDEDRWLLDVTLHNPAGDPVGTESFDSEADAPSEGTSSVRFCGSQPGRWALDATLTEYLPNGDVASVSDVANVTFQMRKARSRTALTVSDQTPRFNEIVRFRSTSTKERPARFARAPYAETKLQYKTARGWTTLRGSKRVANAKGVTVWNYYWNVTNTYRVRAVTVGNRSYKGSTSGMKRVNQTAGGRIVGRSASRPGVAWVD